MKMYNKEFKALRLSGFMEIKFFAYAGKPQRKQLTGSSMNL